MNSKDYAIKHNNQLPEICPLTESQKGVYLDCCENPDSVKYNIYICCEMPYNTDSDRLVYAVKTAAENHPVLNVTVKTPKGVPSMVYKKSEIEVLKKTVSDIEKEKVDFLKPFDLENGPLYRFLLCESTDRKVLLFDIHHIAFDGFSLKTFLGEFTALYEGLDIEPEVLNIFDVSDFELNSLNSPELQKEREFFENTFGGADFDSKPIPDIVDENCNFGAARIIVPAENRLGVDKAQKFIKEKNLSESVLFSGAFAYTLAKFNGTEHCAFSAVHNGRKDKKLKNSVGMFVKTIPLYYDISDDLTVDEFLYYTGSLYKTVKNSSVPFSELASKYGASVDIGFAYQSDMFDRVKIGDGYFTVELMELPESQSVFDVMVLKNTDGYELILHYNKALYSKELIKSFADMYWEVVSGMLTATRLGDISFTSPETRKVLDKFNSTTVPYDSKKTVVELFKEQVIKTPDNICLVYKDKKYTYKEVDEITDILAKNLKAQGISKNKVVGVLIPRCEYMLLASLGILKAGGAYLPLDPTYPPERLNLMVEDSGAVMLIFDENLNGIITDGFKGTRIPTSVIPTYKDIPDIKLSMPSPEDLFVMLYTSGSTGKPKGVMFAHSNTLVTVIWEKKYFEIDENSHITSYASYGFDAHAFDIYPTVISGGELHIIPEDIRLDFTELLKYYNENKITHTVMTTQVGRQFALMGGHKTLKHLSVAGEKLTPLDVPKGFNMYNLYGPTEGSIITTAFKIDKKYKDVPIGLPVDNIKLYVVDKCGKLLPVGGVGELWIAGPHVTMGYLNRPDKTAEAYGENPFDSEKGYERIYRTGDIVRLMPDGNLQFVGRRDAQVKVRGFRVELTEIEEVIRRFNGIKDATVAAFDDPSGGKFIAAYIVADTKINTDELADFIKSEKPPYMVPAVTMQIDKIPLNQNQKVNKKALPLPVRKAENIILPENDTQRKIFDIIADVIGHNEFGITTDIYDAGLTSIGAIKLNVALSDAFNKPVKTADIKENCTVEKLQNFLSDKALSESFEILPDYPLTETQKGIFVESMSAPESTVYNIPVLIKLSDNIDLDRLEIAVTQAVNAHPYIKTTLFTDSEGNIRAKRNDGDAVYIERINCSSLPENILKPFDLLGGPLYRISLLETETGKYLFTDFHHIICDGTSENILFCDITKAYGGEVLKAEVFSGFENALEEERIRQSKAYTNAKDYYEYLLAGCETGCLPKAEPESEEPTAKTFNIDGHIDAGAVSEFCLKHKFTPNAFFNAVFSFVLSRFSGKESLTYATIYNGRNDSRLRRTVSMCVKTVPMLANINWEYTVKDFITEIQSELLDNMANDIYSFGELAGKYGVNSDIIFVYQGDDFEFNSLCGEKAELINIPSETAKAPVSVNVFLKGNKFRYTVEIDTSVYSKGFSFALADAIDEAAKSFTEASRLNEVTMLSKSAEEKYRVLNSNYLCPEVTAAHKLFEKSAEKYPEKTAVIAAGESLTYKELDRLSNIVANSLLDLNVKANTIVGLVLDRTKEVFITQIGIMKSGGAFLPMIPTYPDERIEFCLTNSESPFVITTEKIKAQKPELFAENKPYKTLTAEELIKSGNDKNPNVSVSVNDMAYCIYTSGSTGTPKGVMIEHKNFSGFLLTQYKGIKYFNSEDFTGVCLACSSISFDMSLMELHLPLCCGKCVYLCTDDDFHNPLLMKELMEKNNAQMAVWTPSFVNNLVSIPEFATALKSLKSIVVGAEAFPSSLYHTLRKTVPDLQIINGYGPTECTICCSVKELSSGKGITIGRPTANSKFYVLDKFGHILPPYAVGELIICGLSVGRGYVKLPEKTAGAFFSFGSLPAYHSGDSVRLNSNSEIDFGGRIDNQIKLRGFRVELDEIEKVMCQLNGIKQSKVIVRNNGTEDYLAGFFTAETKIDTDELSEFLSSRLTYYMVPAVMMQLDSMPLTPNGKIDKKALPVVKVTAKKKKGRKAPKKSLEQRLCEIFAKVLNIDGVYADDNFFELGGTSLTASKVTMMLMSESIEVKYGDIFDNPTPEELAEFVEERDNAKKTPERKENVTSEKTRPALKWNLPKYSPEVVRKPLGNILLTGAVGFLGIHILKELLSTEKGHIYCLVRKGQYESPEIRLKTMLVYYFSNGFDDELKNRITLIDADITDSSLYDVIKDIPFDTVINCAACVKHFADDDILDRINVGGVKNLIDICQKKDVKLIQISTVSVPGIHTKESYENQVRMHENELFVIDDMDNKYAISKYNAELLMFDAIENGFKGKVIRVGNLMGRHSDGEFQANMETNMFISGIRGFALMGKYPISHMTDPMRFSPVDCTARAVVLLAGTNDKFTAFNCDNRYGFDEMKIIDACNKNGIKIIPEMDEIYYKEFKEKLGDDRLNAKLNGLAAYDLKDTHAVDTDNLFTTNILYRIGFSWPLVDDSYLEKAINSVMTLDYFDFSDGE